MAKKNTNSGIEKKSEGAQGAAKEAPHFLIVGLCASAGGLEAFKQFFQKMPSDTGMAFIVVQHLDPTHKSMLSDILRNYTKMKVVEIKDNVKVVPNTVYTIPPNKELGLFNGSLHLMVPELARGHRRTIDYFLRSLAEDQKEKAVGVILSGTGTEGADGLRSIKGEGGLAIVQDPESAKYDGMPRHAIATKAADTILPAEKIPEYLVRYMKNRGIKFITEEVEVEPQKDVLDKIFLLLRDRTGNNFSNYKISSINRRIEKRMLVNQVDKLDVYLKYLQQTPKEIDLLFKDLLIGVTRFFRDKAAFKALEKEVIPKIINNKISGDTIRIWVPACSSGEEAYTIALLFDEALHKQERNINLQVFATDIDKEAINIARLGVYPDSIVADIGARRISRYFTIEKQSCKVKKELRNKVIFAVQNLISDPPFSKLDLISCRNLLIYLNTTAQERVFPILHYSLNPDGFLFLGTSETIGKYSNLFTTLDRKNKIFARKSRIVRHQPQLDFNRIDIDFHPAKEEKSVLPQKTPAKKLAELTEKLLLTDYAPACTIINEKNIALYFYGETGKYLQPTPGEASFDILDMARIGLKASLRTAINKVRKSGQEEFRSNVKVKTNGGYQYINLKVKPLPRSGTIEQLLLVVFEDISHAHKPEQEFKVVDEDDKEHMLELEHELASTKEYLRTTIEELGISNEELKSANEELQSANEELQSTNEELETSKEELQSVNEEMITVNTELQTKIDELSHAHDDMSNLLASTEIGTLFLGSDLEIKRFTPAITKILNILPTDVGRPVSHLTSNLIDSNLTDDAQKVLDSLVAIKKTIQSTSQSWYHMQITPYRTMDNVIDGVVMTFVDISYEKEMEEKLKKSNEHLNLALEVLAAVPFIGLMTDKLVFNFVGQSAQKVLGFSSDMMTNESEFWIKRLHPNDREMVLKNFTQAKSSTSKTFEFRWKGADGKYRRFLNHIRKIKSPGKENEDYLVGIWQDLSHLP